MISSVKQSQIPSFELGATLSNRIGESSSNDLEVGEMHIIEIILGGARRVDESRLDDFVKSRQGRQHSKKLSRHRRDKAREA